MQQRAADFTQEKNDVYKDFVTFSVSIIGILAGFGGLVAYISFKEFREKYQKLSLDFEKKNALITEKSNHLEELARAHEVILYRSTDRGSSLVISELRRLQRSSKSAGAYLCVLIGDEYLALGSNFYFEARKYYRQALRKDDSLARAVYGLALAEFKIVVCNSTTETVARKPVKKTEKQCDCGSICLAPTQTLSDRKHILIVQGAMARMLLAKQLGYTEDECFLQRGKMAECLGKIELALEEYKLAVESNPKNYEAMLYYCIAKIRIKNSGDWDEEEKCYIIELLKNVANLSLMLSKLAYALLWYLYKQNGKKEEADDAWGETTSFALSEMFVLREETAPAIGRRPSRPCVPACVRRRRCAARAARTEAQAGGPATC